MIAELSGKIADLGGTIAELQDQQAQHAKARSDILDFTHLLYETGKTLELAIERTLRLLGYTAETLQIDDLEIDHVIVGPSGKRMIGESEGKETSAIDITKFRQLESNIGEDFGREEVEEPAKGVLFGNGYRLSPPHERPEQFTKKSLTNAQKLRSALVQTADLYPLAVYLIDNPNDEGFKAACREAIEQTDGGIVQFPSPPASPASTNRARPTK